MRAEMKWFDVGLGTIARPRVKRKDFDEWKAERQSAATVRMASGYVGPSIGRATLATARSARPGVKTALPLVSSALSGSEKQSIRVSQPRKVRPSGT